jgi:hypothetical protein
MRRRVNLPVNFPLVCAVKVVVVSAAIAAGVYVAARQPFSPTVNYIVCFLASAVLALGTCAACRALHPTPPPTPLLTSINNDPP